MATTRRTKVLVIGAGPAGYTAAIYAARANLKPILVQGLQPGGQLTITTDVENYPGFAETIQGPWLMEQMVAQATKSAPRSCSTSLRSGFQRSPFARGEFGRCVRGRQPHHRYRCAGALARPAEREKFQGFGVSGCATCDGFFFAAKRCAWWAAAIPRSRNRFTLPIMRPRSR